MSRIPKLQGPSFSPRCPVDSFANKLLHAQRQAGRILAEQLPGLELGAIQQSFLLRAGSFVGVRWQAGDWSVEWLLQTPELIQFRSGAQFARFPLVGEACGDERAADRAPSQLNTSLNLEADATSRRAA
ncbi:MAG: hypothetical protein ACK49R_00955 [Planctomycetota bacterium]|jgi:hypothetical protein